MSYRIEHLKLGGILDQAIALTRNHFGLLFGIMLCLLIPFQLIQGFVPVFLGPAVSPDAAPEELLAADFDATTSIAINLVFAVLGGLVVTPVTNAAVINAVARLYLGLPASAAESIKRGFALLPPLIWTTILYSLVVMGGMILLIIPGILFALWFGLYQHVVVIEGINGTAALSRSKQLVRPYLGTFLMLGLVMVVLGIALGLGVSFIPQWHVQHVVMVLLQAVLTILATAAGVVFYFSCRCGVENFDLQYLAEAIGREAAPEGGATATDV